MDQDPKEQFYHHLFDILLSLREDVTESPPESTSDLIPAQRRSSESLSERCWVPVDSLVLVDSPRVRGINLEHARALAELDAEMPPITVQRETMRVVDGMHRLHAAVLRGRDTIEARFFEGSPDDAFVLAVRLNVRHGLPLSRVDRNAAAKRIVRSHPDWSDRLIASVVGLSPKTVGAIRVRSSEEFPQLNRRVGRDGRIRQTGGLGARGTSDPVKLAGSDAGPAVSDGRPPGALHRTSTLHALPRDEHQNMRRRMPAVSTDLLFQLRRDPSLRMTESGRHLLRFMDIHSVTDEELNRLIECVPPHCVGIVVRLATDLALRWNEFADALVAREPTATA